MHPIYVLFVNAPSQLQPGRWPSPSIAVTEAPESVPQVKNAPLSFYRPLSLCNYGTELCFPGLRLLGPLLHLPGHQVCRGRPGGAQVSLRRPPSGVVHRPAEGQRSCGPRDLCERQRRPQGQRTVGSCLAYGPAFGLGARWAEEMGSRRQITGKDRLNMGYTPIYMSLRNQASVVLAYPQQAAWKEKVKPYKGWE